MKNNYRGLIISDVHVGAFALDKIYMEFQQMFLLYIKTLKELDFLIITGDFFDHKFFLNDKESVTAYKMMKELFDVCRPLGTKIRIVYGTESHECNQYDIMSLVYPDVRVIKYAESEYLFDNLHVLYIPEEHLYNKDEYYKKFFTNDEMYDYIFGHGIIREVMTNAVVSMENKETKNSKQRKVPIFSSSVLSNNCKGQVFFGHYHINKNIDNKVFYVGSFSRWCFGEEESKGFYDVSCNLKTNKFNATFIENSMAETFVTIGYGYDNDVYTDMNKMDLALSNVDKMIDNKIFDHVRFEFNMPDTVEQPESTINYLKERYKFNDKIKLEIVHGYVEERKKQQKEKIEHENSKYSFIFSKEPLENKVSEFVDIEYHKDISIDDAKKYLYFTLSDILKDNE